MALETQDRGRAPGRDVVRAGGTPAIGAGDMALPVGG